MSELWQAGKRMGLVKGKISNWLVNSEEKLLTVLIIFTVFILSCNVFEPSFNQRNAEFPEDSRVDRSFVTEQPCKAPCWYGLRLEESTVDEIRTTLLQLPFVDQSTLAEWDIGTEGSELGFHFDCVYYNPPGSCGVLETNNGKLSKIVMSVQYPLTLHLSIDQLGTPEFYNAAPSPTEDTCVLNIFWPEKNIIIVVEEATREKHCSRNWSEPIDLDLQVTSLVYMNIDSQNQEDYEGQPWSVPIP